MQPVSAAKVFNAVYFVESVGADHRFNLLAIRPKFYEFEVENSIEKRCDWEDTSRGAYFYFVELILENKNSENQAPPRSFQLIAEGGERVRFTYLTRAIFEEKVKNTVYQPAFMDRKDEALQNYYLENEFPYL